MENISRHASRSGLGEAHPRGDQGDSSLVNRLSLRGLPLQPSNVQLDNEIFHAFSPKLLLKSEFAASDSHRFGTNAVACAPASAEGAARNLKEYAACASSKNRDFAAHDLAIRRVHQLPGKR